MITPARSIRLWLPALAASLVIAQVASAVTIDWATVGRAGNACDPQSQGCFGGVAYSYQISKYETTNAQYAEFLNAVAATDTNNLFNTNMADPRIQTTQNIPYLGGIERSGSQGSYSYRTIAGRENLPVNWISFYDTLRFANWLHNGQPIGAQNGFTTEDGAYTFSGETTVGERNAEASIFLTSEDEWYKAAYYNPATNTYFDYPTATDVQLQCALPGATPNTASCGWVSSDFSEVGSYTGTASAVGTFDQAGNVIEWNETLVEHAFLRRGLRGGTLGSDQFQLTRPTSLMASAREQQNPAFHYYNHGFRVARAAIPEPSTALLLAIGLVGLAAQRKRLS